MLRGLIGLSSIKYMKKVYLNVLTVALLSAIVPCIVAYNMKESFATFVIVASSAVLSTASVEFFIGCNRKERDLVKRKLSTIKSKLKRHERL